MTGRIVERVGMSPDALADADLDGLGITTRRQDTIRSIARAWQNGLVVEPGADRADVRSQLLDITGVGPWTANYIALRALGDPDVFLVGDLVVRKVAERLGLPSQAGELAAYAERWAPWRSYATHYLWENAS